MLMYMHMCQGLCKLPRQHYLKKNFTRTQQGRCHDCTLPVKRKLRLKPSFTTREAAWVGPKLTVPASMKDALHMYKEWFTLCLKVIRGSPTFVVLIVFPRA